MNIFLAWISLVGVVLVLVATSRYGAGVSSDAARNLSTADNLLQGKGFVDMVGTPFVLWPPLYPVLLAGLSLVTRLSTFLVAWYLNVALYGLNIWLAGRLLHRIFPDNPLYSVAGALIVLSSRSMLRIHANVASEPLFEALLLGFLFAAAAYLTAGLHRGLWWMCIAAGLAALQRYLGVVLLGLAAIVVLRREGTRGLARSLPPILVSTLPIAVWMIFHNFAATGTLFGPRELGEMLPIQNMGLGLTKILWWFIPRWGPLDWLILRPLIPLAVLVILLFALNNARSWKEWWGAISDALVWPGALFGLLYFVLLAFTVVTADHLDLTSDRYYVVLLPIVTALAFITLDRLILARLTWRPAIKSASLVAALILWAVYPVYAVISYLQLAVVRGEPTNYNIANSAQFREMGVVKAAEPILMQDPDALVYSNYINIVWFIFGHPVHVLPFEPQDLPREERLSALRRDYPNWPEAAGYLIWFTPNQYHHIVSPEELSTIADLRLLYEDETGRVYSVGR